MRARFHKLFLHPRYWTWAIVAVVIGGTAIAQESVAGRGTIETVAILYRAQKNHEVTALVIASQLRNAGRRCILIKLPRAHDAAAFDKAAKMLENAKPGLIAAGGTQATILALESVPDVPVVFFLVPNALDAPFMTSNDAASRRVGGLTTDIHPNQQLRALRQLCPDASRVGVPHSDRTIETVKSLQTAASELGIEIIPIKTGRERFAHAIETLKRERCDSALMIPDAAVYDSVSVQRLILYGLQEHLPVWAFSEHVVKAGALSGQYCEYDNLGQQTATIVVEVLDGESIGSIGLKYPSHVDQAVNTRTADMVGIRFSGRTSTAHLRLFGTGQ